MLSGLYQQSYLRDKMGEKLGYEVVFDSAFILSALSIYLRG